MRTITTTLFAALLTAGCVSNKLTLQDVQDVCMEAVPGTPSGERCVVTHKAWQAQMEEFHQATAASGTTLNQSLETLESDKDKLLDSGG